MRRAIVPAALVSFFIELSRGAGAEAEAERAAVNADPGTTLPAAPSLAADIEAIRGVAADLAESERRLRQLGGERARLAASRCVQLELDSAELRQAAVQKAIDLYRIDVSRLPYGVSYSPHGGMREREGATYVDRDGTVRVQIGDAAFASAAWLASTIGHEVEVHVNRQIAKGVRYLPSDEQGTILQEVEAYDYELASADRYGLSADERKVVRQRRASLARMLQPENRRRADEHFYRKW